MRANLDELQQRAGGGPGGRGELIARFNAQCTTAQQQPQQQQPANFLDAIFGTIARQPSDVQTVPLNPDQPLDSTEAEAGSKAVCVRACDGAFFPVSYSASQGRLGGLEDMCRALCPNADVSLYTYPPSGQIEQAVSINGAKYMDMPNALKYRQSLDPTCSCKRKGESWADALAGAEAKLGRESKGDVFVTPEKSIELSRPKFDAKAKAKTPPTPRRRQAARDRRPVRRRAEPAGGDDQPRSLGHRRRRSADRRQIRRGPGSDGRDGRPRRRQAEGADNRSNALTRPISGSRAASSGPDFAAGQRQPQRVVEVATFAAGSRLERRRPRAPGLFVPRLFRQTGGRLGEEAAVLDDRRDRAVNDPPPLRRFVQTGEIAARRRPERLGERPGDAQRLQPLAHGGEGQVMQHARRQRPELGFVETRRGARDVGEVEAFGELGERGDRPHRLGRADQHRQRRDRERFDAALAQASGSTARRCASTGLRRRRR